VDLAIELQKIYDSEINISIGWFWDRGITIRIGDEMNGFLAEDTVPSISEVCPWLQEAIAHFYPTSTYAANLSPEIRQRAAGRLFLPPKVGAQVRCTHCGAPHATPPGMDELFIFVCAHCGNSVEVPQQKVQ
jgi:DNA-directed RNA polymerase subunit RPC12/RpoP